MPGYSDSMIRRGPFRGIAFQHDKNGGKGSNTRPQGRAFVVTKLLVPIGKAKQAVANHRSTIRKSKRNSIEHNVVSPANSLSHQRPTSKNDPECTTTAAAATSTGSSVKKWMRRVLPKELSCNRSNGKSIFFPRIRKTTRSEKKEVTSSPTISACGKTVTDESSSKYSHSRNEDIPREMMLAGPLSSVGSILRSIERNHDSISNTWIRTVGGRDKDNLFFEDDYEDDSVENVEENARIVAGKTKSRAEHSISRDAGFLDKLLKHSNSEKGEETIDDDEPREIPIPRSEILSKLFPFGYSNVRKIEDESTKIAKHALNHDEYTVEEKENCRETRRSSFHRSEVIRSLFPLGHPDDRKKKENKDKFSLVKPCLEQNESITFNIPGTSMSPLDKNESVLLQTMTSTETDNILQDPNEIVKGRHDSTGSESSGEHESDKLIGFVITFDPTWDLLAPEETDSTATIPRSRLKKFHEIENYSDSLLGKFVEEESSKESTVLNAALDLSFETEPSMREEPVAQESLSNSFELGFHFDRERFANVDPPAEIEICFYSDDEVSIECITQEIATKESKIKSVIKSSKSQDRTEIHYHPGESTEIIFHHGESNYYGQVNKVESKGSFGTTWSQEFDDCIEYEHKVQSLVQSPIQSPIQSLIQSPIQHPIQIFESSPEIHSFSPVSITRQLLAVGNSPWTNEKNKDAPNKLSAMIEGKTASKELQRRASRSLDTPPHLAAKLSPPSVASSYHSTKSFVPSDALCQGEGSSNFQFYDAVMIKSPDHPSNHQNMLFADPSESPLGIYNTTS
uniref:Uncharacterized protein n=1 Tax=Pseudo-nitzschia australis TaxID=44445 RepID=A0A7S4AIC5_9STRA